MRMKPALWTLALAAACIVFGVNTELTVGVATEDALSLLEGGP